MMREGLSELVNRHWFQTASMLLWLKAEVVSDRRKGIIIKDAIIHCSSEAKAEEVKEALKERMEECGLELHPVKAKIVYCKDSNRGGTYENISFDLLGYTFKSRMAKNSIRGVWFINWLPAVSNKAMKSMNEKIKGWSILRTSGCILA